MPADSIGWIWYDTPHYLVPDDKIGEEAFSAIREAMVKSKTRAISRLVLERRFCCLNLFVDLCYRPITGAKTLGSCGPPVSKLSDDRRKSFYRVLVRHCLLLGDDALLHPGNLCFKPALPSGVFIPPCLFIVY